MDATYLHGKTAWVTGSSRGIGRAIALDLARQGCNIAIHGRTFTNLRTSGEGHDLREIAAEIAQTYQVRCLPVQGDLSNEEDVRRTAREIRASLGDIQILVCCAGGGNLGGEVTAFPPHNAVDFELDFFNQVMRQNLLSTVLTCREVVPDMVRNQWGRVVTIGSIAGCGGNKTRGEGHVPYSLAKNAVHQYTRLLAAKLRHDGIPVNCVIPGNIDTPVTHRKFHYHENPGNLSRLEYLGKPQDIAGLVTFLCGQGGEYISGECIRVDGGEQLSPC